MKSALEGGHLERELTPEPIVAPAVGSFAVHGLLLAALISYGLISGLFHHSLWGNPGAGGAMQVNLTTAIPLPNNQPLNNNVLATEKPSQAPAPPSPKEEQKIDETAIPIQGKQVKPKEKTTPKTPKSQPQPQQQNMARYGEQAGTSIPRATQPTVGSNGPTSVGDADFASMFGWYVNQINRKMATVWNRFEVDQRTPKGARVYLVFSITRDGVPGDVRLQQSSGSPTLDRSCINAVRRVDTFGPLPPAYRQNTLMVSYYCEY